MDVSNQSFTAKFKPMTKAEYKQKLLDIINVKVDLLTVKQLRQLIAKHEDQK